MSPRAEFPPKHLALGHNVPQTIHPSADRSPIVHNVPPYSYCLGRVHKRALERTSQFEVSSIKESSIEDDLWQI